MGMTIEEYETIDLMAENEFLRKQLAEALKHRRMFEADYENRLKADLAAMLEEIDLQFDEICFSRKGEWKTVPEIKAEYKAVIQERINELRGGENEQTN